MASPRIEELRRLEAAATPGPWARDGSEYSHGIRGRPPEGDIVASWDNRRDGRDDANIDFIVASRNALPLLLDVVEAAQRYRDKRIDPMLPMAIITVCGHALDDALAALDGEPA